MTYAATIVEMQQHTSVQVGAVLQRPAAYAVAQGLNAFGYRFTKVPHILRMARNELLPHL